MNELATVKDNLNLATSDFDIPNGYICTFDIDTIANKIKLSKALNGAVSMRDKVGETLRVVDFVTTQGVRSRDGSICTNSYLICDDGTVYMSQSDGIARSVKVNVALFTDRTTHQFMNPVEAGVGFTVEEQLLQNGNTIKMLVATELK